MAMAIMPAVEELHLTLRLGHILRDAIPFKVYIFFLLPRFEHRNHRATRLPWTSYLDPTPKTPGEAGWIPDVGAGRHRRLSHWPVLPSLASHRTRFEAVIGGQQRNSL